MAVRSHLDRPMDLSLVSNRLILGMTGLALVAAVVLWATGSAPDVLWAPVHVFVIWALAREIDPDHDSVALIAALAAGLWVFAGLEVVGALAVGGLAVAARLILNSTGRRPLVTDLVVIGIGAAAISFTPAGWVAGFGLAIAIYVDDRLAPEQTIAATLTAALAALGASGVATAAGAFPQDFPDLRPLLVVAVGALSLIAIVREPSDPTSFVDSSKTMPIGRDRLHGSRSLVAVLVFAMAFLLGPGALSVGPLAITLAMSIISAEIARLRDG